MNIEGIYLDGKTSNHIKARLEVFEHTQELSLHFLTETGLQQKVALQFDDLKIESRLGNTPREISFNREQLFITEDNNAIDQLIGIYSNSKSHSLLHRLESNLPLIFLFTAATIVLIFSFTVYGIPKLSKSIAFKMPEFATQQLGTSLAILDKTVFEPTQIEEARRNEIQHFLNPYLAAHQSLNPQLDFRSGMEANALALPGGKIIFTDDFVKLAENNEELLAVLFHELGHLKHKHMLRRALQDSMITLLVIFITGDVESFDLITGLPTLILDLSYSREFEKEADTYALEQLQRFNIPLENFATIMQRLEDSHKEHSDDVKKTLVEKSNQQEKTIPDFLSTHPSTVDRIKFVVQFKKEHNIN